MPTPFSRSFCVCDRRPTLLSPSPSRRLGRVNRQLTTLEWLERAYPTPEVQAAWRARAWECEQRAGDALVVPAQASRLGPDPGPGPGPGPVI